MLFQRVGKYAPDRAIRDEIERRLLRGIKPSVDARAAGVADGARGQARHLIDVVGVHRPTRGLNNGGRIRVCRC